MTQPELLYRLQQIDSRLEQAETRLRSLDRGELLETRAGVLEDELTAVEQDLSSQQGGIKALELELQATVAKRAHVEEEMYSGRVRNPKELASMQEELGQLGRQAGGLEESILGLMERVEGALQRVQVLKEGLGQARVQLAEVLRTATEEEELLRERLGDLLRERDDVVSALEPSLMRRYERLRERKGGIAVAAVHRGICEGCHVAVPEGRVRRLEDEQDDLITCEGCGRILVIPTSLTH